MVLLPSVDSRTTFLISIVTIASFTSQVLVSKRLNTRTAMDITPKIVNSICEKSLQRWLFNLTLEILFCTQM
jgi:hypothetical protein